jgi:hypothetical protein
VKWQGEAFMKINVKERLKGAVTGYKTAFFNAPFAMILFGIIGVLSLVLNRRDLDNELSRSLERILWVCVLGVPLSVLADRIAYSFRKKDLSLLPWLATAVFLILYYFFGLPDFSMKPMTRLVGLFFVFLAAYILFHCEKWKIDHAKYTLYILQRLFFAGIYTLVLWGGIFFTFFAFSELMDMELWNRAYFDILIVVVCYITSAYFFYGLPKEKQDPAYEIPPFITTMLSYILIPVILAYTAVLYLYFIRLLITFRWPEGILGHLVLWYGLVSAAVMFFLKPFAEDRKITRLFYGYFPYVILVPLVMMFISLGIRIRAYGFTEPRYFTVIAGAWVFLSMCLFLFNNRERVNRGVLAAFVILCFVSVMSPFSAYAVSVRSQNNRFRMLEEKYQFLSRIDTFNPDTMEDQDRMQVQSILWYFEQNHSLESLNLPKGTDKKALRSLFQVDTGPYDPSYRYINVTGIDTPVLDIQGYDYLLGMYAQEFTLESKSGVSYKAQIQKTDFVIQKEGSEVYRKDLAEYIVKVLEKEMKDGTDSIQHSVELPSALLIFEDMNESFEIRYFIQSALCRLSSDGTVDVENIYLYTAVKIKD